MSLHGRVRDAIVDQRVHSSHHLARTCAGFADLVEREVYERLPTRPLQNHARHTFVVDSYRVWKPTARQDAKKVVELVENLHGGARIVDSWRQCPLCDIDELSDAEERILIRYSLGLEDKATQRRGELVSLCRPVPDHRRCTAAIDLLPEGSGWRDLAELYRTLAEIHG